MPLKNSQKEIGLEYIEVCRKKLDILKTRKVLEIDVGSTDEKISFTIPFNEDVINVIEHTLRQEYQRLMAIPDPVHYSAWEDIEEEDREFINSFWRQFG